MAQNTCDNSGCKRQQYGPKEDWYCRCEEPEAHAEETITYKIGYRHPVIRGTQDVAPRIYSKTGIRKGREGGEDNTETFNPHPEEFNTGSEEHTNVRNIRRTRELGKDAEGDLEYNIEAITDYKSSHSGQGAQRGPGYRIQWGAPHKDTIQAVCTLMGATEAIEDYWTSNKGIARWKRLRPGKDNRRHMLASLVNPAIMRNQMVEIAGMQLDQAYGTTHEQVWKRIKDNGGPQATDTFVVILKVAITQTSASRPKNQTGIKQELFIPVRWQWRRLCRVFNKDEKKYFQSRIHKQAANRRHSVWNDQFAYMQQPEDDLFTIQGTTSVCMNQEQNIQSRPSRSHDIAMAPTEDVEIETSTREDQRLRRQDIQEKANQLQKDIELMQTSSETEKFESRCAHQN